MILLARDLNLETGNGSASTSLKRESFFCTNVLWVGGKLTGDRAYLNIDGFLSVSFHNLCEVSRKLFSVMTTIPDAIRAIDIVRKTDCFRMQAAKRYPASKRMIRADRKGLWIPVRVMDKVF